MAIINTPPDVYYHDQVKKHYGVSPTEVELGIQQTKSVSELTDAIRDISRSNPNINITININDKRS